jgi:hypothetical protein
VVATSFVRLDSRFFSSVRKNTLIVVRSALCGLQSSADSGECSQTGHEAGSVDWQLSQMACSQQGRRNALTASLLQMAHRSFAGMSSCGRELGIHVSVMVRRVEHDFRCDLLDELRLRLGEGQRRRHFVARQSATDAVPQPKNFSRCVRLGRRDHRALRNGLPGSL